MILPDALEYAEDERFIVTPALEIANSWRAAALPIGIVLMLFAAFCRLLRFGAWKTVALAIGTTAALIVLFWLLGPVLKPLGKLNLVIFFVGVVAANVFAGVPIAFSFALATFGYLSLTTSTPMVVMVGRLDEGMSHLILLAVPLFIFLGALIEMTGMARAMIQFLASLLGHVRGGLSYVLVGAMYLVSGISGSKIADMAAIAPVLFPEMQKRGAKPGDLVALLSATGAQTETIPPSIVLDHHRLGHRRLDRGPVHRRHAAGRRARHRALLRRLVAQPGRGPQPRHQVFEARDRQALPDRGAGHRAALRHPCGSRRGRRHRDRGLDHRHRLCGAGRHPDLPPVRLAPAQRMLVDTASLTGAIIFIIGCATAMAWGLTQSGFSQDLAKVMAAVPGGTWGFLAISIVAFVILGSVLEGIPAIVLFGPLLFPIAKQIGVHEVHYSMVVIFAMGIGLFAPPFGVGYYGACAISKINPDEGLKYIWAYVAALLVGLVIVAAVPWISIGFL
jgi:TRAP-type C4-dicarboxylate transport system permease large subunit